MLKTFQVALGSLVLVSLAVACDKGGPENACTKNGAVATISGDPGHSAEIPADSVKRGMGGTYAIKGTEHEHVFVLKDEEMKTLQQGTAVKTRSSSVNAHLHEIEIKCK